MLILNIFSFQLFMKKALCQGNFSQYDATGEFTALLKLGVLQTEAQLKKKSLPINRLAMSELARSCFILMNEQHSSRASTHVDKNQRYQEIRLQVITSYTCFNYEKQKRSQVAVYLRVPKLTGSFKRTLINLYSGIYFCY